MVTGSLKNYTDENIIELIESLKSKSIAYNLSDLKAILAEVNNRRIEGDYAEVLGELIRDKILNGDVTTPLEPVTVEETETAPAEESLKEEKPKKEKKEKKVKEKVKTIQQKAKDNELEVEEEVEKYPVLNFLTGFLKFLGWFSFAVSVIYSLVTSVTEHLSSPAAAIGTIFSGLLTGTVILLLCYWKSESISVKLDIEEHLNKIAGDK